jgi:hypothetical protein
VANYSEHLSQANKNILILEKVNQFIPESWDWQVTIAYYSGLHLANAHIAHTINQHYRTHGRVGEALNPYTITNPSKFEEDAYVSYLTLQNLSRRSRYLINDKDASNDAERAHFTSEKHLAKAVRNLETILVFFSKVYGVNFRSIPFNCERIKKEKLTYFNVA